MEWSLVMERDVVINNRNEFIKKYPDNTNCVECSIVELLVLFINLRADIVTADFKNTEKGITTIREWIGEPIKDDAIGIINGRLHYPDEISDNDIYSAILLLNKKTKFQKMLYALHPKCMKSFLVSNNAEMCGNLVYTCTDKQFDELVNSIDFKFTTIRNLLTAIRSDLVDSKDYGKIRTVKDVYLIDLKNTTDNKLVGYAGNTLK
jgi:hypothetical protein